MAPERGTTCREMAVAACSRTLGPARCFVNGTLVGTGGGVPGKLSSLCPLPTSSARGTQGQKLCHDRKIKKIQLLVYSLTKDRKSVV